MFRNNDDVYSPEMANAVKETRVAIRSAAARSNWMITGSTIFAALCIIVAIKFL